MSSPIKIKTITFQRFSLTSLPSSNLYVGTHNSQQVFTWVATGNVTSFSGDIAPFVTGLANIANGPQPTDYLGYYAFGSETLYASDYVTFAVPKLELDVNGK
jgi:Glycosyl hydrolase family 12